MNARRLAFFCLILSLWPLVAPAAETLQEARERVPELVEQLGSEKYVERRAAQRELERIGLAAFDKLYAALDHPDPEVATTASRLLSKMTVRWAQPGDSPAVRGQMDLYGRIGERERAERIEDMAALEGRQGLSVLCRVARFELSPSLANQAAVAVLNQLSTATGEPGAKPPYRLPEEYLRQLGAALEEMDELYGPSGRNSVRWLHLTADRDKQPADAAGDWAKEFDRALAQFKRNEAAADPSVVRAVGWGLLRAQLSAGNDADAAATAETMGRLEPTAALAVLTTSLGWMTDAGADDAIELVLKEKPDGVLYASKQGLYLAARTRLGQGDQQEAERLAEMAFEKEAALGEAEGPRRASSLVDDRVIIGLRLRRDGHTDWAAREYRRAIEEGDPLTPGGAIATWELTDLLQDAARYDEASATLKQYIAVVDESDESRAAYKRMFDSRDQLLRPLAALQGSEAYFRALAAHATGDSQQEQTALREAVEADPSNADILIAMYRAAPPEHPLREDALARIKKLAEKFERDIDQDPGDSTPYNQWAWLISNTEGDYQKAVRYSRRSLDLAPGDAGYLDTLGRCYYAAGDLEKAIEAQRQAVAKEPQYQIMRRQLELFEKALAEQQN